MGKTKFFKIMFLVLFWTLAVAYNSLHDGIVLGFRQAADLAEEGLPYSFIVNLITSVLFTVVIGTIMASFEVLFLNKYLRKLALGKTIIIKSIYYLSNIFFWSTLAGAVIFSSSMKLPLFHSKIAELIFEYISSLRFFNIMSFWGIIIPFSLFLLEVSDKFGQGVLLNFILGKYHRPKEVYRIFMFMDLKSSTTYAERLGNIKFIQLIQDCFFDITQSIIQCEAEIYQYVGDEVILSWKKQKGIKNNNCLKLYFEFDSVLKSKKEYYKKKYGIMPEFKAGLHAGKVIVSEVGELKKELSYNGDVLNTAARIEGLCNEFKKEILISETLKELLHEQNEYSFNLIKKATLRGKEEQVNIYDVIRG